MKINIQNFSYDPLDSLTKSEPVYSQKKQRNTQKRIKTDLDELDGEENKNEISKSQQTVRVSEYKRHSVPKDLMKVNVVIDEKPEIDAELDELKRKQEIEAKHDIEAKPVIEEDEELIEIREEVKEEVKKFNLKAVKLEQMDDMNFYIDDLDSDFDNKSDPTPSGPHIFGSDTDFDNNPIPLVSSKSHELEKMEKELNDPDLYEKIKDKSVSDLFKKIIQERKNLIIDLQNTQKQLVSKTKSLDRVSKFNPLDMNENSLHFAFLFSSPLVREVNGARTSLMQLN
jgi:hypothetical protein